MNRNMKKLSLLLTVCGIIGLGAGCSGGAGTTNNDQGIAVTFLGFFRQFSTSCTQLPNGFAGGNLQMSSSKPEPGGTLSDSVFAGTDSASNLVAVVGVQNNLYSQIFRGDRMLLQFFIAGASIQPPSTTIPLNLFAGPGNTTAGGTTVLDPTNGGRNPIASALPPTFSNTCNRAFAQTIVVPASVREWINFNRDSLPETPFVMEVTAKVSGLSSAGDRFETASGTIPVVIVDEILVTPTEGTDDTTDDAGLTDGIESDSSIDGSTGDAVDGGDFAIDPTDFESSIETEDQDQGTSGDL